MIENFSFLFPASLAGGTSFLHCDLLPVEDDHGKIQKLVKFFQEKNWVSNVFSVCIETSSGGLKQFPVLSKPFYGSL